MTKEQFRSDSELRGALSAALNTSPLAQAMFVLSDSNIPLDVLPGADAIASVRELSRIAGYQDCLTDLRLLSMPIEQPEELPEPTYLPPKEPEA